MRNTHLPDHLLALLEGTQRRMIAELTNYERVTARGSYVRIAQMVPPEGIRVTDLAALANMTKQALGQFVDEMEAAGLVTSERLATDRRVRLVRRTAHGDEVCATVDRVFAEIENKLRAEVGERRYQTMRKVLGELSVI